MAQNNFDPEPSLTQLCSICHLTLPKYTCPRCFTRTCSLPCAQKHKRWAQCTGVRDPTAYVKRKDLATERGFDADFNFLSGVERGIERAGRVVENRGMDLEGLLSIGDDGEARGKRRAGRPAPARGEIPFMRAVESSGVKLVRAPKGMARQKMNLSGWHRKHKCINWYVEWVLPGGGKEGSKAFESMDVEAAFERTGFAMEQRKGKKEGDGEQPRKKRKVGVEGRSEEMRAPPEELATDEMAPLIEEVEDKPNADAKLNETSVPGRSSRTVTPEILPLLNPTTQTQLSKLQSIVQPSESEATQRKQEPVQQQETISTKYHFYLHRPRSRSKIPVLIPVSGSTTLTDALRGRTILEYPTIYVLDRALTDPRGPEDKFVLEEEYLRENPDEREIQEEADKVKQKDVIEEGEAEEEQLDGNVLAGLGALTGVDEKEVMKVLQQDLGED